MTWHDQLHLTSLHFPFVRAMLVVELSVKIMPANMHQPATISNHNNGMTPDMVRKQTRTSINVHTLLCDLWTVQNKKNNNQSCCVVVYYKSCWTCSDRYWDANCTREKKTACIINRFMISSVQMTVSPSSCPEPVSHLLSKSFTTLQFFQRKLVWGQQCNSLPFHWQIAKNKYNYSCCANPCDHCNHTHCWILYW